MRSVLALLVLASCFVVSAWCAPSGTRAQDAVSVRDVQTRATLHHAGVVVAIGADDDGDATGRLEIGTSPSDLRPAHPLVRVAGGRLVGSLFGLSPATTYTLRVHVTDPDGGDETRDVELTTRSEPVRSFAGATLQVSPGGSDTGEGTSSSPFATITHAVSRANPGDTILVRRGAYHEQVVIGRSGEPGRPIAIIAEMGTLIDGSYPELRTDTAWRSASRGVWRASVEAEPAYVAVDDQRLYRFATETSLRAGEPGVTRGGWSWDSAAREVLIRLPDGLNPGITDVRVGRFDTGISVDGQHDVWIEDLEIRNYGREGVSRGVVLRNSDRVVLRDLLVHHVSVGIEIDGGSEHLVEGTELYDRGASGWAPALVEGTDADGTGVLLAGDLGPGHVLRDLSVHGFYRGVQPCGDGGAMGDVELLDSLVFDVSGPALDLAGTCVNVRVVGNRLIGVHAGFALRPAAVGPVWIVRNGVFPGATIAEMSGATATMLDTTGANEEAGVVLLYHNTTRATGDATPAASLGAGGWASLRARNNVFAGTDVALDLASGITNLDLDYDALSGATGVARSEGGANTHADIGSLFAALGIEEHGLDDDPGFATTAMGDIALAATSALIDRGIAIAGVNDDAVGVAPDIGAFELGALDAGGPSRDAGVPSGDGGVAPPPPSDGAMPPSDDATAPARDSGRPAPGGGDDDGGCGCEAAGAEPNASILGVGSLVLVSIACVRRRRQRQLRRAVSGAP